MLHLPELCYAYLYLKYYETISERIVKGLKAFVLDRKDLSI